MGEGGEGVLCFFSWQRWRWACILSKKSSIALNQIALVFAKGVSLLVTSAVLKYKNCYLDSCRQSTYWPVQCKLLLLFVSFLSVHCHPHITHVKGGNHAGLKGVCKERRMRASSRCAASLPLPSLKHDVQCEITRQ